MRGGAVLPAAFDRFREVWVVDTEYLAPPGSQPEPVCVVAEEVRTGRTLSLWQDQFGSSPPYGIGEDALVVAYAAPGPSCRNPQRSPG